MSSSPSSPPATDDRATRRHRGVEARRAAELVVRYPAELPITERRDELLATLAEHQVVVVAGETGSGKSTQLPKLCLELGRGVEGLIGHTQPRRLAARTVAERVAEELGTEVGAAVGYAVRFTDRVGEGTRVKVMTDGILLAEIQRDPLLRRYDTLIIDEAHERSLNIDVLLGYLKDLLPRRPDLKVVITSATIDTARFSEHFGGAPIIEVTGRTYPVEVRYRPFGEEPDDDRDQVQAICDAIEELAAEGPGDVLVFLSGEREIHDTADAVRRLGLRDTEVVPLYARLSSAEQHRIFQPHRGRRVVLATNVAETSLTVPGIRSVVDAGTARISRYSRRLKVQRLPIEPVSQASADQRAGRCGRVAPGTCIRLYSREDYDARPEFTEPEVLRTNLASVVLQLTALGVADVAAFPFVEPPDARAIRDGIALLEELGALRPEEADPRKRLTSIGRKLARLPIDPRLGRMVLEADRNGCVREVIVIAAALSIQDPRERPSEHQQAADEAHRRFAHPDSDFLTLLNLWEHLRREQRELSSSAFRRRCKAEHLNHLRVREWQDLVRQLRQVSADLGIRSQGGEAHPDAVHRSLLAGLLSHIGLRDQRTGDYRGARNARFAIARGSVLAKKGGRWVMAAELVETNRLWGRVAARIRPEWVEDLAGHLVTRSYTDPEWDPRRGTARTIERVSLFGLPLVGDRHIDLARVDRPHARELFIRNALVDGDWQHRNPVIEANHRRIDQVLALEHRFRRRDLYVGDEAVALAYHRVLGPEVTSPRHLDGWLRQRRREDPDALTLGFEQLLDRSGGPTRLEDFPDTWRQGDLELRLSYEFEPTSPTDGVTVHVPVGLLNQVRPEGFDWLVPGLREELVTALVRTLPKPVRKHLTPAPDRAREALAAIDPTDGPLLQVLARELTRMTGAAVRPDSWQLDRLPPHLRTTFSVDDAEGRPLAIGRDLPELQRRLRGRTRSAIAAATEAVERSGLRDWTFGDLPEVVEAERDGHTVRGHPALVDEGGTVAVRTLTTEEAQRRAMPAGVRRLLLLTVPVTPKAVLRDLAPAERLALATAPYSTATELLTECLTVAADELICRHGGPPRTEAAFRELQGRARRQLVAATADTARTVGRILAAAGAVQVRLGELTAPALGPAVTDITVQLARLLHPGWVTATGARRLPDLLRYLAAIDARLDKLGADPARDRRRAAPIEALEAEYRRVVAGFDPADVPAEVAEVRWLLEELRVSTFAQHLGTGTPVSEARIRRRLAPVAAAAG